MTRDARENGLHAVIFDFDGIVADTEKLHYLAFERVLAPRGLGIAWEDYVERCIGFDDRDVFRLRLGAAGEPPEGQALQTLVDQKALAFIELVQEEGAPIYPGVWTLVRRLHEAGLPLCVCSGALRSDIDAVLRAAGFGHSFALMVTAEEVAHSKPDPESYLLALEKLRRKHPDAVIRAERVIAIEDTPSGITAARGAGLRVLGVTNTHPREALAEAHQVVDSLDPVHPDQLTRWVADARDA